MGRKPNAEQKRASVQRYARKARKGVGPDDRRCDRSVEGRIRRTEPEDLDRPPREDSDG
jgi:hypothetical protein